MRGYKTLTNDGKGYLEVGLCDWLDTWRRGPGAVNVPSVDSKRDSEGQKG